MPSVVLNQVEEAISRLSREEQLWLIEQLAHHLRKGSTKGEERAQYAFKSQLIAMSSDSEIQTELKKIDREFTITEADGLERQ